MVIRGGRRAWLRANYRSSGLIREDCQSSEEIGWPEHRSSGEVAVASPPISIIREDYDITCTGHQGIL